MQPRRLASLVMPSLLLIALATALPATAGLVPGACSGRLLKWKCVGLLDIVSPTEIVRIRFHEDDRTVVEVAQSGTIQRMLVTPGGA